MTQKPYKKEHAENLLIPCAASEQWEITERGVSPKPQPEPKPKTGETQAVANQLAGYAPLLSWRPAVVFKDDTPAPDLINTPSLPFPFDARDLAVFMLNGVGSLVADFYGEWDDGPDKLAIDEITPLDPFARQAVTDAYVAYREAQEIVGPYPSELDNKAERARKAWGAANKDANQREGVFDSEPRTKESTASRERAKAATAALEEEMKTAAAEAKAAHDKWLEAMVRELLKPAPAPVLHNAEFLEKEHNCAAPLSSEAFIRPYAVAKHIADVLVKFADTENPTDREQEKHRKVCNAHADALAQKIQNGEIEAFDENAVKTQVYTLGTVIRRTDAAAYAAVIDVVIEVPAPKDMIQGPATVSSLAKSIAREVNQVGAKFGLTVCHIENWISEQADKEALHLLLEDGRFPFRPGALAPFHGGLRISGTEAQKVREYFLGGQTMEPTPIVNKLPPTTVPAPEAIATPAPVVVVVVAARGTDATELEPHILSGLGDKADSETAKKQKNGTTTRWTPEELHRLKEYRSKYTEAATAQQFGVSGTIVRRQLAKMREAETAKPALVWDGLGQR